MKKEDLKRARQFKTTAQNENALLSVPASWCVRFNLTPTELLILRHIQYMTKTGENRAFTGSIKSLCAITNCALPTARRAVDKLHEDGWINKSVRPRNLANGTTVYWVCLQAQISYDTKPNDRGIESELRSVLEIRQVQGYKKPNIQDKYN